ncbi:MAG TPA: hypothetical protein VN495_04415, partial [Candidatus Paceibacterota bacterium]|nr:hypothetical protein [Candidatus Paceibacterota bacterium]
MMPVHVNYSGTKVPENGTYYMVARNGMLMHVRNDWVDAVVPMKEFQALEPVEIRAQLKLPPIDALVFAKAVAFFSSIYIRYGTEAIVLLHYGAELGWQLSVPRQQVSRSQVRYKMDERIAGYQCVGTMHSHADMLAGHSHVDIADEGVFDGVHLTVGSLERVPQFSLDAEIVVRGQRFPLGI